MKRKDFIEIHDYTAAEVQRIFTLARQVKKSPKKFRDALKGQTLAMIFEKSSTRTRVSFEVGMFQLGGHALFLSSRDIQLGRGEPIADTAKVLSRYVNGIMARTFAHKTVTDLAENATVPVINGLTDLSHPCQAMTDYFTAWEHLGKLKKKKIAPRLRAGSENRGECDRRRQSRRHEDLPHPLDRRGGRRRRRRRDRRVGVDGAGRRSG